MPRVHRCLESVVPRRPGAARLAAAGAGAVAAAALIAPPAGAAASPSASPSPTQSPVTSRASTSSHPSPPSKGQGFRVVESNLDSPQPWQKFQQDDNQIRRQHPDFQILNEVAYRHSKVLAPAGYSIWRTPGRYSGETPVVWNSNRWTITSQGTSMISNRRGVPSGFQVQVGMRYANWATFTNGAGREVSIVSAHYVPPVPSWPNLAPIETKRLGHLMDWLSQRGPVIAGGDLNKAYGSRAFPRRVMNQHHLVPTYDVLGAPKGGTGDHHGNTIDFTLMRQRAHADRPVHQYTMSQNSDHKAVVTDFHYVTKAASSDGATLPQFRAGVVNSRPKSAKGKYAAINAFVNAMKNAGAGGGMHVLTNQLTNGSVGNALIAAKRRGVHVQVMVRNSHLTGVERKVRRALGNKLGQQSWFRRCGGPKCHAAQARMPGSIVLVSQDGQTPSVRMLTSRGLNHDAVARATRVLTTNGLGKYLLALRHFRALY